jgi:hypothetical protein
MFYRVKHKVEEVVSLLQAHQAIDDQRIKGALDRPANHMILDLNDELILNVGELITHKVIDSAQLTDAPMA